MSSAEDAILSVEAASVVEQPSAWARVRRNGAVRVGGGILLLLVLVALAAPWLGTVDPSLFDPASRDLLPGKTGEITTLEGEQIQHRTFENPVADFADIDQGVLRFLQCFFRLPARRRDFGLREEQQRLVANGDIVERLETEFGPVIGIIDFALCQFQFGHSGIRVHAVRRTARQLGKFDRLLRVIFGFRHAIKQRKRFR